MRCPACKAENSQAAQCRRCKADLSLLLTVEQHHERALAAARRFLAAGETAAALAAAAEAERLRRDDESRRLLALARLLNGDFAGAWACYRSLAVSVPVSES